MMLSHLLLSFLDQVSSILMYLCYYLVWSAKDKDRSYWPQILEIEAFQFIEKNCQIDIDYDGSNHL